MALLANKKKLTDMENELFNKSAFDKSENVAEAFLEYFSAVKHDPERLGDFIQKFPKATFFSHDLFNARELEMLLFGDKVTKELSDICKQHAGTEGGKKLNSGIANAVSQYFNRVDDDILDIAEKINVFCKNFSQVPEVISAAFIGKTMPFYPVANEFENLAKVIANEQIVKNLHYPEQVQHLSTLSHGLIKLGQKEQEIFDQAVQNKIENINKNRSEHTGVSEVVENNPSLTQFEKGRLENALYKTFATNISSLDNKLTKLKRLEGFKLAFDKPLQYRVRVDISSDLTPPYENWLKDHVEQMSKLTDMAGDKLFSGIQARVAKNPDGSKTFVIDYDTTELNFNNYQKIHADKMRSVFAETYKDVSVFKFARGTLAEGAGHIQQADFNNLEKGPRGMALTYSTLVALGSARNKE